MDQPIRPKPSNAHKPRIRIKSPGPGRRATYNVYENGEQILLGFDLPDVYDAVVAIYCTEQAA